VNRRPIRRHAHKDPVTEDVRFAVLDRDQACILYQLDPSHECRDRWGNPHRPDATWLLSLEHVKPDLMAGQRGPSTARWMVAMCYAGNVGVPSKAQRNAIRAYLQRVSA